MKKLKKYLLYALSILLGLLVIAYIIANIYLSSHKKELLAKAGEEISNEINGKVSIADMSVSFFKTFPYLTVSVYGISIEDSLYRVHKHKLLAVEQVYARINPFRLLIGSVRLSNLEIQNGALYLYTDTSGYTNAYMLQGKKDKPKKPQTASTKNLLEKIKLLNFRATIADEQKNKRFDFLINKMAIKTESTDSSKVFEIDKSILVKDLGFKYSEGSFLQDRLLEGKYKIRLLPRKKELRFDDIDFSISGQPFHFSGAFKFGTVQAFELHAQSKNLLVDSAKKILSKKIAKSISIVSVMKPLDVDARISGSLQGGDPLIVVNWTTRNNEIVTPLISLTDCNFSGLYTNEVVKGLPLTDPNSKVEVNNLTGKLLGLPITVPHFLLNNLTIPDVTAQLKSSFQLQELNDLILSDALSLVAGTGNMEINYRGAIDHISPKNSSITGFVNLDKGVIEFAANQSQLTDCMAHINLKTTDLVVEKLSGRLAGNPITITAEAKNVLSMAGDSNDPVSLSLDCKAPLLNINKISSIISRKYPVKPKRGPKRSGALAKSMAKLDNLLSSGKINLSVNADKLVYKKFEGAKLNAQILIDENAWNLQNASLSHGTGTLAIKGMVSEEKNQRFRLNSKITMKDLDAKKIWYSFNDFGMKALGSKNLEGKLSADVNLSLLLDKNGGFDLNSLSGDANLSIKNGKLINFAPLENIHNFLLGDRNFHEISFAEIHDDFKFKKGEIEISRMEINSNVLSLFVEGVYSLTGKTDISVQVPVSNLKKRKKDYKPQNEGTDRNGGMSVFLRATTAEDGTIKIKYDPFKRFRKSKSATDDKKASDTKTN